MNNSTDEEMVAWVDENEQLIKPIPISLANSDPKYLHPEVAILLFDQDNRVLLQKRAATKRVLPGVWICSAAGHITYGESKDVAAHRELQEEVGFDVTNLFEVTQVLNTLPNERHIAHWYLGRYQNETINLNPREADEYTWMSVDNCDTFAATHTVSTVTIQIAKRFWSGEWDKLLQ